ncbi:MAG: MCE family protein [Bacteroidales bacterium]|nr:MCE family protein [Bacteroidales bacterium]
MKIRREIKIGALFILALAAFIWGFNYLKGTNLFYNRLILYAVYDDIGGLTSANPIYLKGMKIGQVHQLNFEGEGSTRIIAKLMIDEDVPIPINSVARIHSSDIMGSKAIDLKLGDSPVLAQSNDTILSDVQASLQEEVNKQVQPIKHKAEELLSSLDTLVTALQAVFDDRARSNLGQSFESIRLTIRSLEHTSYTFDTLIQSEKRRLAIILENIESISTNLRNSNEEIANTIRNISSISDSLAATNIKQTFAHIENSLNRLGSVMDKVESGEGTLGLLINDPGLYNELEVASMELNQLLEDMKLNPGRYVHFSVFGSKVDKRPYTPPAE